MLYIDFPFIGTHYIISAGFAPGVDEKMTAYTVSKHGVVAMTRTMATSNTGIMHKAICPAWTDTEIVSTATNIGTPTEKSALEAHIKKSGGLMTPEFVAEGFFRLLTQCGNGATMVVLKDSPYIVMPDFSVPVVTLLAGVSKLIGKVMSTDMVTGTHITLALTLMFLIFCYLLTIFF